VGRARFVCCALDAVIRLHVRTRMSVSSLMLDIHTVLCREYRFGLAVLKPANFSDIECRITSYAKFHLSWAKLFFFANFPVLMKYLTLFSLSAA